MNKGDRYYLKAEAMNGNFQNKGVNYYGTTV